MVYSCNMLFRLGFYLSFIAVLMERLDYLGGMKKGYCMQSTSHLAYHSKFYVWFLCISSGVPSATFVVNIFTIR
jgi:hypothetical protein